MQMVPVKALEQEVVLALLQQVQEPREAEQEQSVRVAEWLVQEQEAEPVLQAVASVVPQEHRVVSQQLALVLLVQEQLVLGVQLELVRQALQLERQLRQRALDVRLVCQHY